MRSHATGCLKGTRTGGASILHQFPFAYNTTGISSGLKVGSIEASATNPVWVRVSVAINTVFNASTNAISIGTTATATEWMASADIDEATAYIYPKVAVVGSTYATVSQMFKLVADTDIYIKYTQAGTAATTGAGDLLVEMFPGNSAQP